MVCLSLFSIRHFAGKASHGVEFNIKKRLSKHSLNYRTIKILECFKLPSHTKIIGIFTNCHDTPTGKAHNAVHERTAVFDF